MVSNGNSTINDDSIRPPLTLTIQCGSIKHTCKNGSFCLAVGTQYAAFAFTMLVQKLACTAGEGWKTEKAEGCQVSIVVALGTEPRLLPGW